MLGRVAYSLGDDEAAADAYAEASTLVDEFTATLDPSRVATFVGEPVVAEILAASGASPARS